MSRKNWKRTRFNSTENDQREFFNNDSDNYMSCSDCSPSSNSSSRSCCEDSNW